MPCNWKLVKNNNNNKIKRYKKESVNRKHEAEE